MNNQGLFLCLIFAFDLGIILNIETSTKNCSVGLAQHGELIELQELNTGGYSHAEKLHPFIQEIMKRTDIAFSEIDAVAVGKGPGSYTGLRIGVSAAKGLCFAHDIPLISINSLEILARASESFQGMVIPMIDARRMEVYSAVFDHQFHSLRETRAEIVTPDSFSSYLNQGKVLFLGDGAEKCKEVIQHINASFLDDAFPSASCMAALSFEKFQNKDFEDVAYFEPFYLKDFVATPEKKK